MVGQTHALGWLATVMAVIYFLPPEIQLQISIFTYFLAIYSAQWPDVDLNSEISKNPIVKVMVFPIKWLISGHRSKETHSLFGNAIFMLYTIPLIPLLWFYSWLLVWVWYFSHLLYDFFNKEGVPLFYFPVLNSDPRKYSLYNFIPYTLLNLVVLWFSILRIVPIKWLNEFLKKSGKLIMEKKIGWVWIRTGTSLEKVVEYGTYIGILFLWYQLFPSIWNSIKWGSSFLSIYPIIAIILWFWIVKDNQIKKFLWRVSGLKLSVFNALSYKFFAQILIMPVLLLSFFMYWPQYIQSFSNWIDFVQEMRDGTVNWKDVWIKVKNSVQNSYIEGYDEVMNRNSNIDTSVDGYLNKVNNLIK